MESANETGRRAANVVLERSGSAEVAAAVALPYRPPEWETAKAVDAGRWAAGQPNAFDVTWPH